MTLFKNILLTILLVIPTSITLTIYSCTEHFQCNYLQYFSVPILSISITLLFFTLYQYRKTLRILIRKRPHPIPIKTPFAMSAPSLFFQDSSQERHWVVNFTDDTRVVISTDNMYLFVTRVCEIQRDIELQGKRRVRSPISQREHLELGRKRWQAKRKLLIDGGAVEELNKNVIVLKQEYISDPWKCIKDLESRIPTQEV